MASAAPGTASPAAPFRLAGVDPHLGLSDWRSADAGFLAYADVPGYRVAAGEPRVPSDRLEALFREFERDCRAAGRKPVYFGVPASALEFLDPGKRRARWHVGDLPVFESARWSSPRGVPAEIRSQTARARNHGVTVRLLPRPPSDPGPLRECLESWLRAKPLPPLGFLTTPFLFDPWPEQGVWIAERDGRPCGFLAASASLSRDLWRADAVGRAAHAPNGCSELLVSEAFRHAHASGFARLTLGLAPLARRSGVPSGGLPGLARILGRPFYSFAGLERFKAKFRPDAWRPLYCVSAGKRVAPGELLAVGRVFAGGSLTRYALRSASWKLGSRRLPEGLQPPNFPAR